MNVSRSKIDVKMQQLNIKTFRKSFESFEQILIKLTKIYSNLSSTSINQILNEINDSNSKYFESSEILISTSTNRIFNVNSIKAFKIFDDLIEKSNLVPKKIDSIFI